MSIYDFTEYIQFNIERNTVCGTLEDLTVDSSTITNICTFANAEVNTNISFLNKSDISIGSSNTVTNDACVNTEPLSHEKDSLTALVPCNKNNGDNNSTIIGFDKEINKHLYELNASMETLIQESVNGIETIFSKIKSYISDINNKRKLVLPEYYVQYEIGNVKTPITKCSRHGTPFPFPVPFPYPYPFPEEAAPILSVPSCDSQGDISNLKNDSSNYSFTDNTMVISTPDKTEEIKLIQEIPILTKKKRILPRYRNNSDKFKRNINDPNRIKSCVYRNSGTSNLNTEMLKQIQANDSLASFQQLMKREKIFKQIEKEKQLKEEKRKRFKYGVKQKNDKKSEENVTFTVNTASIKTEPKPPKIKNVKKKETRKDNSEIAKNLLESMNKEISSMKAFEERINETIETNRNKLKTLVSEYHGISVDDHELPRRFKLEKKNLKQDKIENFPKTDSVDKVYRSGDESTTSGFTSTAKSSYLYKLANDNAKDMCYAAKQLLCYGSNRKQAKTTLNQIQQAVEKYVAKKILNQKVNVRQKPMKKETTKTKSKRSSEQSFTVSRKTSIQKNKNEDFCKKIRKRTLRKRSSEFSNDITRNSSVLCGEIKRTLQQHQDKSKSKKVKDKSKKCDKKKTKKIKTAPEVSSKNLMKKVVKFGPTEILATGDCVARNNFDNNKNTKNNFDCVIPKTITAIMTESTRRKLLTPVAQTTPTSPLTPVLAPISTGKLITCKKELEVSDILDDLTHRDLLPILSEYPRKDECVNAPSKSVKKLGKRVK